MKRLREELTCQQISRGIVLVLLVVLSVSGCSSNTENATARDGVASSTPAATPEPQGTPPATATVSSSANTTARDAVASSTPTVTPELQGTPPATATVASSAGRFVENGDGTITDNGTGLLWEKKSKDGSIHNFDDLYTLSVGPPWLHDGTVSTVFLAQLNAQPCFADFCDWRLPSLEELTTMVQAERFNPAAFPEFDQGCSNNCNVATCSCIQPGYYWSSTTHETNVNDVWCVDFASGRPFSGAKSDLAYVRAVRRPPVPTETPSPMPPTASPTLTPEPAPELFIEWIRPPVGALSQFCGSPPTLPPLPCRVTAVVGVRVAPFLATTTFTYAYQYSGSEEVDGEVRVPLLSGTGEYGGVSEEGDFVLINVLDVGSLIAPGEEKLIHLHLTIGRDGGAPAEGGRAVLVRRVF